MDFTTLSPKQLEVITDRSDAFITILSGSVRSGKTFSSLIRWLFYLKESPHELFIMAGRTTDSVYRNCIIPIQEILGTQNVQYKAKGAGGPTAIITLKVNGKRITKQLLCVGGDKIDSEKRIRGITVGGAYIDEGTIVVEGLFKQLLNRCSLPGAQIFVTTNPDSPWHWLKVEYLDKADELGYKHYHFILEDNYSLDERYKENIKKAYSGLFYDRFILGLWVLAQGAVYQNFSEAKHTVLPANLPTSFDRMVVGCDYGITNPQVYLKAGVKMIAGKPHIFILDEYYNVSEGKTDDMFLTDYNKFTEGMKQKQVIIDPSAASLINLFKKHAVPLVTANNAVIEGIANVSNFLEEGRIHIVKDKCPNLIKEFNAYVWDEKASTRGEDKPLKVNDHCMDTLRYIVNTLYPAKAINIANAVNLKGGLGL